MTKSMKPGSIAPTSGQYEMVSSSGRPTNVERTVVRGEPLPPTLRAGQSYRLADATKTSGRKGR